MQAFQWDTHDHLWAFRHMPYMPHVLHLSHAQNLNHIMIIDENDDSGDDSKFDAFPEELNSNWYDL